MYVSLLCPSEKLYITCTSTSLAPSDDNVYFEPKFNEIKISAIAYWSVRLFVCVCVCSHPTSHDSREIFIELYTEVGIDPGKN